MEEDVDDFLAHYGVKGMKWGVRRSQAQLDRAAGRTTRKEKRSAKREASIEKHANQLRKQASSYKMKRGTREELLKEREKVQRKISAMDMNEVYNSLGALGGGGSRKDKKRDASGRTSFQRLTAQEKHNLNQKSRNKLATKFVGKSAANAVLTVAVYTGGGEALMRVSGMPESTRAAGRRAMLLTTSSIAGKTLVSDISRVRTESKFKKLSDRRHEIDKQLKGQW